MGRIIIFTGKGGVGKTSTASAHALKAAREGKKTLVVSTDMAHNLSDIFQMRINQEPTEVEHNLYALEIDPNHEMELHYGTIRDAFGKMMPNNSSEDEETIQDIVVFPGIEELFSLIKIKALYESKVYDLIVVDCAPTGETLALLKFPELLSWYMEKLFPIGKVALKVLRPVSNAVFSVELPDKHALNDIERLYLELASLQRILRDREITSIRIVAIPEKMVVEESKRSYMYLNLYDFNVDALYINRMIPAEVDNTFFEQWKQIQGKYVEELNAVFASMPIYPIKWYEADINGIKGLERVIEDALKDENIFEVLRTTSAEAFEKLEQGYRLKVYVPFVDKTDFELFESGSDVIIKIGNFKRNIPIPNSLLNCQIQSAKLEEGYLNILFS